MVPLLRLVSVPTLLVRSGCGRGRSTAVRLGDGSRAPAGARRRRGVAVSLRWYPSAATRCLPAGPLRPPLRPGVRPTLDADPSRVWLPARAAGEARLPTTRTSRPSAHRRGERLPDWNRPQAETAFRRPSPGPGRTCHRRRRAGARRLQRALAPAARRRIELNRRSARWSTESSRNGPGRRTHCPACRRRSATADPARATRTTPVHIGFTNTERVRAYAAVREQPLHGRGVPGVLRPPELLSSRPYLFAGGGAASDRAGAQGPARARDPRSVAARRAAGQGATATSRPCWRSSGRSRRPSSRRCGGWRRSVTTRSAMTPA